MRDGFGAAPERRGRAGRSGDLVGSIARPAWQEEGGSGANVIVHGTAVIIKPIKGYVPTGAIGNILAEMADQQMKQ